MAQVPSGGRGRAHLHLTQVQALDAAGTDLQAYKHSHCHSIGSIRKERMEEKGKSRKRAVKCRAGEREEQQINMEYEDTEPKSK